MLSKSGIYQIRNTVNGKIYVGSAKILKRRWSTHRECLRKNKHHSRHLQSAWNKHGEAVFVFEPLITCAPSMMLWYEQQFLDQLKPEYNISPTAGNCLGVVCSDEKKAKISKTHTGKVLTPEHRAAIGRGGVGRTASAQAVQNMCNAQQNRVWDPEVLAAASKRMRERNVLPETRAKISAAKRGRPLHINQSEELTERRLSAIREYNRTRPITAELLKNMSEGQKRRAGIEEFEFGGERKTVLAWAEQYGLDRHSLRKRLNAGWTMERALTTPVNKKPRKK